MCIGSHHKVSATDHHELVISTEAKRSGETWLESSPTLIAFGGYNQIPPLPLVGRNDEGGGHANPDPTFGHPLPWREKRTEARKSVPLPK